MAARTSSFWMRTCVIDQSAIPLLGGTSDTESVPDVHAVQLLDKPHLLG